MVIDNIFGGGGFIDTSTDSSDQVAQSESDLHRWLSYRSALSCRDMAYRSNGSEDWDTRESEEKSTSQEKHRSIYCIHVARKYTQTEWELSQKENGETSFVDIVIIWLMHNCYNSVLWSQAPHLSDSEKKLTHTRQRQSKALKPKPNQTPKLLHAHVWGRYKWLISSDGSLTKESPCLVLLESTQSPELSSLTKNRREFHLAGKCNVLHGEWETGISSGHQG